MTLQQLRWRCRRGTKELDLVLGRFIEQGGFEQLDASGQAAFYDLLEQEDHLLQEWLIFGSNPREGELARIVERIRQSMHKS
ncbi:succinate dehydrogenase assembly factor 2 [Halorhodospira halochloris]|uniref:FAD assembly factor SdhE n=1 Tax=Halorhodospira halochloris TaxID=1052 RepID=UPI001EE809FD|nr:succinate dehydrogenase assembly factor 2 [Halorhodospira halochloris]